MFLSFCVFMSLMFSIVMGSPSTLFNSSLLSDLGEEGLASKSLMNMSVSEVNSTGVSPAVSRTLKRSKRPIIYSKGYKVYKGKYNGYSKPVTNVKDFVYRIKTTGKTKLSKLKG
jgi:hypothetical protein